MQPQFRTDLNCSREEQQGSVFYRIDDPSTQTSFRLYEIEYLIAQKLDGRRTIPEIIESVKSEYNFDLSESDLSKFISQLESMGFVQRAPSQATEELEEADTQVMDAPLVEAEEIDAAAVEADSSAEPEIELLEPGAAVEVDEAELQRLLKSAFLHIKQGYVLHARDYAQAARELNPEDDRLTQLVKHMEILDDDSSAQDLQTLWDEIRRLFPDVLAKLQADGELAPAPESAAGDKPANAQSDDDLRARTIYFLLVIGLLIGGGVGGYWLFTNDTLFATEPEVHVSSLEARKVPLYVGAAEQVEPWRSGWLKFGTQGIVDRVTVDVGAQVSKGDILGRLRLAPPLERRLRRFRRAVERAQKRASRSEAALQELLDKRQKLEARRDEAKARLKELRPKSVLRAGGISKRDLRKWTRVKARTNKRLSRLARRTRRPRKRAQAAERKLERARRKLQAIEDRIGPRLLRAEFGGVVAAVKVAAGERVNPATQAILVEDASQLRLRFTSKTPREFQKGGEAKVALASGEPVAGKVVSVARDAGKTSLEILVSADGEAMAQKPPEQFRLIEEVVDPAFLVDAAAVFQQQGEHFVTVALQGRALKRTVEVVAERNTKKVIRDTSGTLRDGQQLVVSRPGGANIASIADGSFLRVVESSAEASTRNANEQRPAGAKAEGEQGDVQPAATPETEGPQGGAERGAGENGSGKPAANDKGQGPAPTRQIPKGGEGAPRKTDQ